MDIQDSQFIEKYPWFNTIICTKLHVQSFKYYFKTVRKERYELMCYVDMYEKEHVLMPDYASSGGRRPVTTMSSKKALFSLGHKIIFIGY